MGGQVDDEADQQGGQISANAKRLNDAIKNLKKAQGHFGDSVKLEGKDKAVMDIDNLEAKATEWLSNLRTKLAEIGITI